MSNTGDPRGGRVWARMVSYIIRRDPHCKLAYPGICTGASETADHIIPVARGGRETPDNLQGACKACNWHRGKDELEEATEQAMETHPTSEGVTILFDGAEKPSHRKLLEGEGVTNFALSYWRLRQRGLPQKGYLISNYFAEHAEVYVDSGWMQAQDKLTGEELLDYVEEFEDFLDANADHIAGVTEMHLGSLGADWINSWRADHEQAMGTLIWPVWTEATGMTELASLAERFDNVALTSKALENVIMPARIGALHRQHQTAFHALGCANPETLRGIPLETASTLSWAAPQMRGETIVWDNGHLVRHRADRKDQVRPRYKAVIETAGLDYEAVLADNANEVTKLAIWSYLQLEKSMDKPTRPHLQVFQGGEVVTQSANPADPGFPQDHQGGVGNKASEGLNSELARREPSEAPVSPSQAPKGPVPRPASERATLPVFGVQLHQTTEIVDGHEVISERPVIQSRHTSLRQCDTCVIQNNCPAFEAGSTCAFELPVEVKTKDQLKGLLNTIIEMQGQRIAFARFAEEVNGGYPDPNLSQEVDRLFKLVKTVKELEDNREFVRMTVERQTSGGVLSNIFGDRANALQEMEKPVDSNDIMGQIVEP